MATNPYVVLGVSSTASQEEIKKAYHIAARKWHPDSFGGSPPANAEHQMRKLNEAWSQIGDKKQRAKFDSEVSGTGGQEVKIDPSFFDSGAKYQRQDAAAERQVATKRKLFIASPFLGIVVLVVAVVIGGIVVRSSPDDGSQDKLPFSLGADIEIGDCINVIQGPALLEVPCTENADGVVIGARLPGDERPCVDGTTFPIKLSNGAIGCIR